MVEIVNLGSIDKLLKDISDPVKLDRMVENLILIMHMVSETAFFKTSVWSATSRRKCSLKHASRVRIGRESGREQVNEVYLKSSLRATTTSFPWRNGKLDKLESASEGSLTLTPFGNEPVRRHQPP